MYSAGLISMGGYLPAKKYPEKKLKGLVKYLREETMFPEEYIKQLELSGHLPGTIETNHDGWESKPWYEAWLQSIPEKKRNDPFQGSKERRRVPMDPVSIRESVVPHPMLPSDAETLAGAMALYHSGLKKEDIDQVIVHSQVPDRPLPANASLVQHKLKLPYAGAFEIDSCCSSFVTMMEVAASMIRSGVKKNILIIGSILDSMINDKTNYYSVNTGDAAIAGVMSRVEEGYGYLGSDSFSDGGRHDGVIFLRRQPHLLRQTTMGPSYEQDFVTFYNPVALKAIASEAQHDLFQVVSRMLEKTDKKTEDIKLLVTHQPVAWTANAWRETIGVPPDRFYESFEKYGNIATASAPVNLLEGIEKGMVKPGDLIVLASSGAGENFIALMERASPQLIRNILE
ncbi:MAG: 3-oxoacyl-ACP synthase III family protein [Bacteroidales bacterium]